MHARAALLEIACMCVLQLYLKFERWTCMRARDSNVRILRAFCDNMRPKLCMRAPFRPKTGGIRDFPPEIDSGRSNHEFGAQAQAKRRPCMSTKQRTSIHYVPLR